MYSTHITYHIQTDNDLEAKLGYIWHVRHFALQAYIGANLEIILVKQMISID